MDLIVRKFGELSAAELYEILRARSQVFLLEQRIVCQDLDGVDYRSLHCFFMEEKKVSAYLRAFCDDEDCTRVRIGRVLTVVHGKGTGRALMEQSLKAIQERLPCKTICLNAQKYAVPFYERFGFKIVSGEFLEEGIVHVAMELHL
ncbi:MAG: GNAT family N-acetyltransferase [Bacteroides sp.]|nr:GNAT family N-acetyltransferase [Prevotella sp.]MCM1408152.1 GNAT family N-acetyltransferase [Treponema brennaborense]MCM1469476.1 GNAT family N-acetyltransferase [Bacteroides sp.]